MIPPTCPICVNRHPDDRPGCCAAWHDLNKRACIEEIIKVCESHGVVLSHQDINGAFIIADAEDSRYYQDWLWGADTR